MGLLYNCGLEGRIAAVVVKMVLPVPAAMWGRGITYRGQRVGGAGGHPGGGGRALAGDGRRGQACVRTFALAQVPLALAN